MTHPSQSAPELPRSVAVVLIACVVALALVLVALHLAARASAGRAATAVTLGDRLAAARIAAAIEPWNFEFSRRAHVLQGWERGRLQLELGDYNGAVDTLRDAYSQDVGNVELLALFKRAQETQALETNRKAHLQHGHEGPGGTLRPEDIER